MRYRQLVMGLTLSAGLLAPIGAQAEGWGQLGLSFQAVLPGGGVASEGVGLSMTRGGGSGSGVIPLLDIPAEALVHQAFLYWGTYGGPDDTAMLNGTEVRGTQIGRDGDTCWNSGDASNSTYRSDVTSVIDGNGTYAVGGIGGGAVDPQGASLVVVYLQPEVATVTDVRIVDGMISTNNQIYTDIGTSVPLGLSSPALSARVHAGFGDGHPLFQNGEDTGGGEGPLTIGGTPVLPANSISGADGPYWDDVTIDIPEGVIDAEAPSVNAAINSGLDCFTWTYLALEIGQPDTVGPIVRGVPDRPANAEGWHDGPVTVHWQTFDGNGATQPADSVITGEGRGLVAVSAPSCDGLGNCATGTFVADIDATAPDVQVRPMEMPIVGELPREVPLRLFDQWVSGQASDDLAGIDTVRVEATDLTTGDTQNVTLNHLNCDQERRSCEFGAQLTSERTAQRVVVTPIDRAGNEGTPVELLVLQPAVPFDECPLGPLCD